MVTAKEKEPTSKTEIKEEAVESDSADENLSKNEKALAIIKRNSYWALGAGVIPVPALDFIAFTAVQVKMIKEIAELYNVPFKESLVKSLITSLTSGASQVAIAGSGLASSIKMIPGIGSVLGAVFSPAIAGSLTYATGKVFNLHFASGGNLLDLNPEKFKDYFVEQVQSSGSSKTES